MGWAFAYERTYINHGRGTMSLIKTRYQKRKLDEAQKVFGETVWWNRYTLEAKLGISSDTARRWVAQWFRKGLLVRSESAIRQGVAKFKYRFN
jgi:predicted transcriptional regulator